MEQMQGASPEHWMLLCDVYYVYYLPSYQIRFESGRRASGGPLNMVGGHLRRRRRRCGQAQKGGFSRTGYRYHQKYLQFWLILLFADHVKSQTVPQA